MSASVRFNAAIVASSAILALATACGGDSGITGPSSRALAQHFDSLYVQEMEDSDISSGAKFVRGYTLSALEIPAAYGADPTAVDVHTAAGVERWHGFEYSEPVPTSDGAFHSTLVLYRDSNVHTALIVDYESAGSFATLVTNDTLGLIETSGTGASSEAHIDGACATAPTLQNPALHADRSPFCTRATFSASLSADLTTDDTADPALSHIEFTATSIEGVNFSGI